jgi:hypothetical protein
MRKYRFDKSGHEQPVWMSNRKLVELGRQEGREAFAQGREPIRLSNLSHDNAARAEFERCKQAQQ